jgi:hypothetical protein
MGFIGDIKSEIAALAPKDKDLRGLCLVFGFVLAAAGGYKLYRASPAWPYLLGAGGLFFVLGAVLRPKPVLSGLYKLWMGLAIVLGAIVSRVILTLLFYVVVTPIGLLRRLFAGDGLGLKRDKERETYWIKRAEEDKIKPPEKYEKMY